MGGGGACKERGCILARNDNKRGVSSDFVGTGDMNVRVGGDLTLRAGSPSSSTYAGATGTSATLLLPPRCRSCHG
jgi:hypothetical protein